MTDQSEKQAKKLSGVELIAMERRRQIEEEGWTAEHDDAHTDRTLALVAALYASPMPLYSVESGADRNGKAYHIFEDPWPTSWDDEWDKRDEHDEIQRLVIAGALIAADIDRLQRAAEAGQ